MFLFEEYPKTQYDLNYKNKPQIVTNIMVRFKIVELIKQKRAVYYNYSIQEGERADVVAYKYYGDSTLDWLIMLTNNIIDPLYDWPLSYNNFIKYVRSKYGNVETAQSTIHEYRWVLNEQSVYFDGTILPKRTLVVDSQTFAGLGSDERETIYKYDYEVELNDAKRNIKLISDDQVNKILNAYDKVFE